MSTLAPAEDMSNEASESAVSRFWIVIWGAILVALAPLLLRYLLGLWKLDHYRFFPFAFAISGWLFYQRWDGVLRGITTWRDWSLLAFGVLGLVVASYLASPWFGFVCGCGLLLLFLFLQRDGEYRRLWAVAFPIILTLRLPLGYDQLLVLRLQRITTTLSSVVLDVISVPHAVSNNVIQLTSRELFVAEACSGVQSVFTLMFAATAIFVIKRRKLWTLPLYILVGIVLAIVANVFRVSVIAAADHWMKFDLASGWMHDVVGYTALLLSILFLLSFDHFARMLVRPIAEDSQTENPILSLWSLCAGDDFDSDNLDAKRKQRTPIAQVLPRFPKLLRNGIVAVCLLLTLSSSIQVFGRQGGIAIFGSGEIIFRPSPTIFDDGIAGVAVESHETTSQSNNPRLGANADIWGVKVDGIDGSVQFVVSQPYSAWHELCICYEAGNWRLLNREVIDAPGKDTAEDVEDDAQGTAEPPTPESEMSVALARFNRMDDKQGYLIYSAITKNGEVVRPPALAGSLAYRFTRVMDDDKSEEELMMLQLFAVGNQRLSADSLQKLQVAFRQMRSKLLADFARSQGT